MSNQGEKDELKVIRMLKEMSESEAIKLFGSRIIVTLPPTKTKADVIVSTEAVTTEVRNGVSIKSLNGMPPAILNHTHRGAWAFQHELKEHLPLLDKIVSKIKTFDKEDITTPELKLNLPELLTLVFVLKFFVFEGTGSKLADVPANTILVFQKEEIRIIRCTTEIKKLLYVSTLVHHTILSLRNKGMPKTISDIHAPWMKGEKGALHIRLKKSYAEKNIKK